MDKIKDIRKALEAAALGPWKSEHDWMFVIDGNDRNAHLIANAPEWLSYLLTELDKLDYFHTITETDRDNWIRDYGELKQENKELQEEVDESHAKISELHHTISEFNRQYEKLSDEFKRYRETMEEMHLIFIEVRKERNLLQKQLKQATEALEHYANEQNWYRNPFGQWEYVFDSNSWEPAEKTLSLIREGESHGTR